MGRGCTIRPARTTEAEALSLLALCSKGYWGYSTAFLECCRKELTYTAEQIASPDYQFFVLVDDDLLAGFYALSTARSPEIELEALFVTPERIGCGYGRRLIEHAFTEASRLGAVRVIVQGDPHATGFYKAIGGHLAGHRPSDSIPGRMLPVFDFDVVRAS